MWLTVVVVAVLTCLLWKCLNGRKRKEPPGPWGLPIVGYLPFVDTKRPNVYFAELAKKHGDVYQLQMGSYKLVVVNGQRAVKLLYGKADFLSKPGRITTRIITEIMDNYLFVPFSASYWIHKKVLLKAMKGFVAERTSEIEEAVHKIVRMVVDEAKKRNRQPFDPATLCEQAACTLVFYHSYGRLLNISDQEVQEAMQLDSDGLKVTADIAKVNSLPWMRFLPTTWKLFSAYKTAFGRYREFMDKLAEASVDEYDGKTRRCFIDFLCHEFAQLDDDDRSILKVDRELIKKTTTNISFFGGFPPLQAAVKWIVFLTALYPDVLGKVREEIKQKIGENQQPRSQNADMLPYTTATFQELTRYLSMAALGAGPRATTCDTELDGYFIAKGTAVLTNLYSANRDGTVFPNPDKFDPQRFLNPDGTLNADAYKDVIAVVGVGPRRCGGTQLWWVELYTFFASMVQCCHIEQAPGCPLDPADHYFKLGVIPSPFKVVIY